MLAKSSPVPLLVIVGETASGKSALAMELAKKFDGEIICADSRTVYKGMNIGTAKPTSEDRKLIKHHLLDIVKPDERFTVADFQRVANIAIKDIGSRGKLPMLVGGTGLYVDSVLYEYQFRGPSNSKLRKELNTLSVDELQKRIIELGLELPINKQNPRHLVRTIESNGQKIRHDKIRKNTLVLGLYMDREKLNKRIIKRVDDMIKNGLVDEVQKLKAKYDQEEAFKTPGYKAFSVYLEGKVGIDDAKQLFAKNDLHLAKQQRTWFKRNKSIHWIQNHKQSYTIVQKFLSKQSPTM